MFCKGISVSKSMLHKQHSMCIMMPANPLLHRCQQLQTLSSGLSHSILARSSHGSCCINIFHMQKFNSTNQSKLVDCKLSSTCRHINTYLPCYKNTNIAAPSARTLCTSNYMLMCKKQNASDQSQSVLPDTGASKTPTDMSTLKGVQNQDPPASSAKSDISSSTVISQQAEVTSSAAARLKEAVIKRVMPRPKEKQSMVSTERNFITAVRAMSEFLLKPADLEGLRKTKRRSPFENEPRITVYWMKDIENKALEKWGSKEGIEKERARREKDMQRHKHNLFNLKRLLSELTPQPAAAGDNTGAEQGTDRPTHTGPGRGPQNASLGASEKVVYTAVAINGVNFLLKFGAWLYTGSACMFAEALHSLADTSNQLILAYGIHKSMQRADPEHPYGYSNMPYVSSLISGAMIFCLGAGVSVHHGIAGLISPPEVVPLYWAFCILGGSLLTEGGTLVMAIHAIRKGAQQQKMTFTEYVMQGEDPSVNVVLLEDTAAVLGVGVALTCLTLTSVLGTTTPDALGSCIIGGILATVAGFIIRSNVGPLVGRSIPQHELQHMNRIMEQDVMIRALHDVKGIDMGTGLVRYKAEVDFDGRELTRAYLAKQNLELLLEEMNNLKTADDANTFLLNFGENIVDTLGAEIDRIEQSLKKAHPEVRHCDLEIL